MESTQRSACPARGVGQPDASPSVGHLGLGSQCEVQRAVSADSTGHMGWVLWPEVLWGPIFGSWLPLTGGKDPTPVHPADPSLSGSFPISRLIAGSRIPSGSVRNSKEPSVSLGLEVRPPPGLQLGFNGEAGSWLAEDEVTLTWASKE